MAYDETLARRVRMALKGRRDLVEKKMFGGLAFLIGGNMCCGVVDRDLMVRVGPAGYDSALSAEHARAMDFTGKPMRGFVYVAPAGVADDRALRAWITRGVAHARSLPPK